MGQSKYVYLQLYNRNLTKLRIRAHTLFYTGITASTIKENDPLAIIGEQMLYISNSSLKNMIPIGEGKKE